MSNYIDIDVEGKRKLNLDACLMIEPMLLIPETKPIYKVTTVTGETVVVRTDIDLTDKIK
jgi:hypothetical protein